MEIKLRNWDVRDAKFALRVRNHPDLMKWFRQKRKLTLDEQIDFIIKDVNEQKYNGNVIEYNGVPIGLCGIKYTGEFTIGVLPEYQKKGLALQAMRQLLKGRHGIWSEVFVGNPALEWFISKLGFKIKSVKQKAYKKDGRYVDVVTLLYE